MMKPVPQIDSRVKVNSISDPVENKTCETVENQSQDLSGTKRCEVSDSINLNQEEFIKGETKEYKTTLLKTS